MDDAQRHAIHREEAIAAARRARIVAVLDEQHAPYQRWKAALLMIVAQPEYDGKEMQTIAFAALTPTRPPQAAPGPERKDEPPF